MTVLKCTTILIAALIAATTFGTAQAALIAGQTIGIDFSDTGNTGGAGSEANFVVFGDAAIPGGAAGVATTDVTGASTGGVTVDLASFDSSSSEGKMGESNLGFGGAGVGDYTGTVFSDLSFNDGFFFRADAPIAVTFNGLDDSLEYRVELLPTGPIDQSRPVDFSVNGGTPLAVTYDQVRAGDVLTPGFINGLSTNGSGQLTLTASTTSVAGIAAVALSVVPEPSSALLLAGLGLAIAAVSRRRR